MAASAKSKARVTFSARDRRWCLALSVAAPFLIFALLLLSKVALFFGWTADANDLIGRVDASLKSVALNMRAYSNLAWHDEHIKIVNSVKDKVTILTIDDETLQDDRFREWPIPRTRYAQMIKFLENAGARAVAIDVLFLDHQKAYPGADEALKKALATAQRTFIVDTVTRRNGALQFEEPLPMLTEGWPPDERLRKVGVTYEADENITSVPLVVSVGGEDRYSFDALLVAAALGVPVSTIRDHSDEGLGSGHVQIGDKQVPTVNGAMEINYFWAGGAHQQGEVLHDTMAQAPSLRQKINYFPLSSLWDMEEKDRAYYFKDRVVLVGVTAQAGHDIKMTPMGKMAGVEVHANALLTVLSSTYPRVVPALWIYGGTVVVCVLLGLMLPRVQQWIGALVMLALLGGVVMLTLRLFANWYLWLPPTFTLLSIAISFALVTFYLVRAERRAKMLMKSLFEKATPVREEDVINFLLSGKTEADDFETELEVRDRTVLFSDIRDYTVMSESMNAERVMKTLNVYYSEMQTVINECGGKIWEYVGDAQMVIFGEKKDGRYPPECQVKPEYAEMTPADQAVHAAINMIERLEVLNAEAREKGMPVLDIGIGINTGPVSLGTIKNKGKLVFAAIGDTTNVAARMQAMSKDLKCRILLCESTFERLEDIYLSEKVENVKVKGKAEPMTVYRIFAGQQAREREKVATTA